MNIVNFDLNDFMKLSDDEQQHTFIKMINRNDKTINHYQELLLLSFRIRGTIHCDVFYFMLFEIYKEFPDNLLTSLSLITNRYGIWEDMIKMIDILIKKKDTKLIELQQSLIAMFQNKLQEDSKLIKHDKTPISNCAIWCPRENGKFSYIAKQIAIELFKEKTDFRDGPLRTLNEVFDKISKRSCYKRYRQLCSSLKRHIFENRITLNTQKYNYDKMKHYLLEYDFDTTQEEEILIKPMKIQLVEEINNKIYILEKEMTLLKLKKKKIIQQQFVYDKIICANDLIGSGRGY